MLLLSLLLASASAQEPAATDEPYLLGDPGIRIDLPKGWVPARWSDFDFHADTGDHAVAMYVWTTPFQSVPTAADLPLYAAHFVERSAGLGLQDCKVLDIELDELKGAPIVRGTFEFKVGGSNGRMYTASVPAQGQIAHIVYLAAALNSNKAGRALDDELVRMETRKPPKTIAPGEHLEVGGANVSLPEGWRLPLENEADPLAGFAEKIPADMQGCSLAVHPIGPASPDVMAICPGSFALGITDEYTFADRDAALRPILFGKAPMDDPAPIPRADPQAQGLLYHADVGGRPLYVGVAPYEQGILRAYVLGGVAASDAGATPTPMIASAASDAIAHATMAPMAIAPDECIAYYVRYRPTHPATLAGECGCGCSGLAFIAGVGLIMMRSRRKPPPEHY